MPQHQPPPPPLTTPQRANHVEMPPTITYVSTTGSAHANCPSNLEGPSIAGYDHFLKGLARGVAKQQRLQKEAPHPKPAILLPSGIVATVAADMSRVIKALNVTETVVSLFAKKKSTPLKDSTHIH